MLWHPPLNPTTLTLLVLAALLAIALSYLWSRRQLDPTSPQGLITVALRTVGFILLLIVVLQPARLPDPERITIDRTLAVLIDNSGSMSLTGPEAPDRTRLDLVREALDAQRFHEIVGEDTELAYYAFDAQVRSIERDALGDLAGDGRATDITRALEHAVRQHQHDDLAGVVLISDGRVTQGRDPREIAEDLGVPVHTLTLGEDPPDEEEVAEEERRDLAVESVAADPRIVLGRTANVAVSVSAVGYGSRQVTVELIERDTENVLATTAVAVSPQQPRRQALFSVEPDEVGRHDYQVRIPPEEDEIDTTNNTASFEIEVVDPINRLLYIDRLRQERTFLNRVIRAQRNLRYTTIVEQDAERVLVQGNDPDMREDAANLTPEQLQGLKAVILGDVPAATLESDQIEALANWVDRGGALLLMAGPRSLGDEGFARTPLARLLPVEVAPGEHYLEEEVHVQLTPDGAAHPAFQRVSEARWADAPPLLSRLRVDEARPAATVLFSVADDSEAPADEPVVVSHSYGHGRVAVVLTDTTWRWQLGFEPRQGRRESIHALFWQQLIDWLMPELEEEADETGQIQLITDRLEYEVGEEVTMIASVLAADGSFMDEAQVEFNIAAPDGRPLVRDGTLDEQMGDGAGFTATFEARSEGEYVIEATAELDGRTLGTDEAHVRVTEPDLEFVRTDPDRQLMRELAAMTDGRTLDIPDLGRLPEIAELAPREIEIQPSEDADAEPVWNRWWLLLAFLFIMAGEWFVRRQNQWV